MRCKKIAIGTVAVFVIASVIALAAALYPYAMVSFSGIKMSTNTVNGSTTQGFVDITLKNINTPGLSFCLEYDTDYLQLSSVDDNVPIENPTSSDPTKTSFNIEHKYFEQNTDCFAEGSFMDVQIPDFIGAYTPIIGIADAEKGRVIMNFLPSEDSESLSDYIGWADDENGDFTQTILANSSKGVRLGRLSFYIKDASKFAKLTSAEIENIIKIVPFSNMVSVEDSDVTDDTGVHISYINEEGIIMWYSNSTHNIDYEFNIKAELEEVTSDNKEITVSSYEIYKDGSVQDLLDYINEKASKVILSYADGSKVSSMFEWTASESNIGDITWDPKGGDYVVTQRYNDTFSVSVTVHVTPVNLIGFITENPVKTYLYGSDDFPTVLEEIELPQFAQLVLDTYLPNRGTIETEIEWYRLKDMPSQVIDLPEEFSSGNPGTFTFIGNINSMNNDIETNSPWITIPNPLPEISVVRNVVTSEDDIPNTLVVESAVTDTDGKLTIVVSNAGGNAIPEGTLFDIKMPDGETIDSGIYNVTMADGKATIMMNPDITDEAQKKLAQIINLGDRAGEFLIASIEPDKYKGEYTSFAPNPRRNTYLPSDSGGDYEFDYSDAMAALFPVKAGTELPTTVTLPISTHRIKTVYNGYDGNEEGFLSTFTVKSWTIDGDITVPGSVVKVTGELADTAYTNYGEVFNDDGYSVTIKYLVVENDAVDSIEDISDFVYNTQQVGYGYNDLQTKKFNVKNIGLSDIYGLSVNIALSDASRKDAFLLTKDIAEILKSGESTDFDITTKLGLPVGEYISKVTIMSNNKALDTFTLTFVVTENPIYKINLTPSAEEFADNPDIYFGSAKTKSGTYTAEKDEVITIVAEPQIDCRFVGWETDEGSGVVFADATAATTTFVMPDSDVNITAVFEETIGAKLRVTELYVKDTDDETEPNLGGKGYVLYDEDWNVVTFDPVTREYYVAVPNDKENVKLWFKPRQEAESATMKLKNEVFDKDGTKNGETEVTIQPKTESDIYYKSDGFDLTVAPCENRVTLSFTYDDSAEGEVTREYVIHIYRKIETSNLMSFAYGNSPYGLIMRDDSILDKDAAKQSFTKNNNTFIDGNVPVGAAKDVSYLAKAWSGVNYDFDDSALFVINTSAFTDPGYTKATNSIGDEVNNISKSIEYKVLSETNSSLQNGSSDDFVYTYTNSAMLSSDGEITEFVDKRIRPDIYYLVYSFKDFDGSMISVKKPIIILPQIGDINISKTTDLEDVSRIIHRFKTDIADNNNVPDYSIGGTLFKYRVCDVNKDGNLNAVDANNIRANVLNPFYANLSEGGGG